jgi:signal transduction histidine kinase
MVELAGAFNAMAADLQHADALRTGLMADVSHELRTPLAALEGNLRAALDHAAELSAADIAGLHSQTRHLIRLVNDLRELSLAETGRLPLERRPANLNALVADALQALEPLAAENDVTLADELPALPVVSADPDRIRQVLFNLLVNALRHTPQGGRVTVGGAAVDETVTIWVADTGEGLDAGELAAVFDRFYRTDRSRSRQTGGSGLGLAIVKAIVEAHGGRATAESAGKGQGSRFMVSLPAVDV